MDGGVHVLMKDDLSDTIAVAQMDKDDAAQVAAAMHPSHHYHARAGMRAAQLAASVSAAQGPEKVECDRRFHMYVDGH